MQKKTKKKITRYAPSPTGALHIGGVRTSLFCYLFARKQKGKFIIRTDDTDLRRSHPKHIAEHIAILNKLQIIEDASALKPDEYGPYLQSERQDIYLKYAHELVQQKKAYLCFCRRDEKIQKKNSTYKEFSKQSCFDLHQCRSLTTDKIKENKQQGKKYAIRFYVERNSDIWFTDIVFDKIRITKEDLVDFIIIKSDGSPNYNFACVVDDYLMEITHIIRGSEHISNTGKQLVLYQALNFEQPHFAHVSLIINANGKKMSKREGEVNSIPKLLQDGIIPAALINFIAFLGWQPDKKKEILSLAELIALFDLKKLSKSPSIFDLKKLYWTNKEYIKRMSTEQFINYLLPIAAVTTDLINPHALEIFYAYYQTRITSYHDLIQQVKEVIRFVPSNQKTNTMKDKFAENIIVLKQLMREWFNEPNNALLCSADARNLIEYCKWKSKLCGKELYIPIRLIINNIHHGMSLDLLILLLGATQIMARLE